MITANSATKWLHGMHEPWPEKDVFWLIDIVPLDLAGQHLQLQVYRDVGKGYLHINQQILEVVQRYQHGIQMEDFSINEKWNVQLLAGFFGVWSSGAFWLLNRSHSIGLFCVLSMFNQFMFFWVETRLAWRAHTFQWGIPKAVSKAAGIISCSSAEETFSMNCYWP